MTPSPALQLTNITKSFGAIHAVNGIDLTIRQGEVVALLGPNGAGKSTTIDIALGLSRPDTGTTTIFGRTPREGIVDGKVGAMLQGGALLPTMSVAEAVSLVASIHHHPLSVAEALERARCTEIAKQKVSKLSGGQLQRARFAVAVVSNPELLLLDEPTAAMDVEARRVFWQSMQDFTERGRTVIFATHYLDEADSFADRVIMLNGGRIVADGTPAEVKAIVAGRRIRAQLSRASDCAHAIEALPGVQSVEIRGEHVLIDCTDSDATLRRLVSDYPGLHDIEVTAQTLDDAFLALTAQDKEEVRA